MMIQKEDKIGEVVAENFRAARVFESFGIDFCCGGKKTISAACSEKGIDPADVINELGRLKENGKTDVHYSTWSADFLSEYIINNHHSYVINTIPTIEHHLQKVVFKHGDRYPSLGKVEGLFSLLRDELLNHMAKEEKMLFPFIKKLQIAKENGLVISFPPFGTVENPIKVMESEHEQAGNIMKEIRELTNNFTPPDDACTTFRVLYNELMEFEQDLHVHIHLENNILFPKAWELESKLINSNRIS